MQKHRIDKKLKFVAREKEYFCEECFAVRPPSRRVLRLLRSSFLCEAHGSEFLFERAKGQIKYRLYPTVGPARKTWKCVECDGAINPGEKYESSYTPDQNFVIRLHLKCVTDKNYGEKNNGK